MRIQARARAAQAAIRGDFSALANANNADMLKDVVQEYVKALGFHYFQYSVRYGLRTHPAEFALGNYPVRWRNRYVRRGYENYDPAMLHCMARITPVIWTPELYREERAIKIREGARQYGLNVGVSFPIHAVCGELAVFSLVTREEEEQALPWIRAMLATGHQLALHIHEAAMKLVVSQPKLAQVTSCLSARETQCLALAARGMTAREIALQLGIAESTVVYHFKRAGEKLGTTDRTRMVAQAVGMGIIAWEEGHTAPPPRPRRF